MMGCQVDPAQLFYNFSPDDHGPTDHMLRGINRHLDLGIVRTQFAATDSCLQRPVKT
jgi:hypothetical protein